MVGAVDGESGWEAARERAGAPGEATRIILGGAETGGRFALLDIRERGGTSAPRHIHAFEDEIVYVVAGEVTFEADGTPRALSAGGAIALPRGCEHTFRVDSTEARLLVLVTPAGAEEYYHELARPGHADAAQTAIERLIVLAARFGMTITGPGC